MEAVTTDRAAPVEDDSGAPAYEADPLDDDSDIAGVEDGDREPGDENEETYAPP